MKPFLSLLVAAVALVAACGSSTGPLPPPAPPPPPGPPPAPTLVAQVPIPPQYGIHDTYLRDGFALACAWNTGLIIYDVGNGVRGGSPSNPVEVSRMSCLEHDPHPAGEFRESPRVGRRYDGLRVPERLQ